MQIILIRHGRPTAATNPRLNASGFANWIRQYNASKVATDSRPRSIIKNTENYHVIASDLKRAVHSCEIYCKSGPESTDALFREMDIPRYKLPFKLKAWTWVYLCRALWTFGVKGPFESYKDGKIRAKEAATRLVELANEHQNVVLFAHGYINLHIRRELKRSGWDLLSNSNQYWGTSVLEKA